MKLLTIARSLVLVLALCFAPVMLNGCASSQSSTNGNAYTRTADGAVVTVTEDEYHIHMPTTIPNGNITFRITNNGKMKHNFKIKGNGIEQQLPADLTPGETQDMTLALSPGSYSVICPILGHPDLGMKLTLNVAQGL